jgi:hypothetical protein
MALILAVNPDRSQGAALDRVGRELAGHQLVRANSCADAPRLLDGRVPDLVLLPPLLPVQEEDELRSFLRGIAGADVRTLTIPLMARPGSGSTGGCEPKVFADQIREYLIVEHGDHDHQDDDDDDDDDNGEVPSTAPSTQRTFFIAAPNRRRHVISAAYAAASWVRARRATWDDPHVSTVPFVASAPTPGPTPRATFSPPPPTIAPPPPLVARTATPLSVLPAPLVAPEPQVAPVPPPPVVPAPPPPVAPEPLVVPEPVLASTPLALEAVAALPTNESAPGLVEERPVEPPNDPAWRVAAEKIAALVQSLSGPAVRSLPIVVGLAILVGGGVASRPYWKSAARVVSNLANARNPITTAKPGIVVFESVPPGSQVVEDGKDLGTTPVTVELPSGSHTVEFRSRNRNRTMSFTLPTGGRIVERVDWSRRPAGQLQVTSEPPGARIVVDGQLRGTTPMTIPDVAAGEHAVVLESASGSVRRTVTIQAGETVDVAESIFAGWLVVFSPFDVTVTEGSREIRFDDRHEALLPPGMHELHFRNRALGFEEVRRVELKPGEKETVSITLPRSTLTVTATEPAEVWVDTARVGDTPLTNWSTTLGTHEVVLKRAGKDDRHVTVMVTATPATLNVDFTK